MVVIIGLLPSAAGAAAVGASPTYRPPTDAPIVDRFRPPATPWGPGNRGVDYGTAAGAPIAAVADGRVVFAGEVGGALHVTVEHADGLRSSYSFVAAIAVARGDRVRVGDPVAIASGPFHLGFRTPDGTYLDPEEVLAGRVHPRSVLVPGAEEGLPTLDAAERTNLLAVLRDTGVAAATHLARAGALAAGSTLAAQRSMARAAAATMRWVQQRTRCTPTTTATPRLGERRIAIEVSGLGTASASNSAWEFDTDLIGYAAVDVLRFSYRGGRVPDPDSGDQRLPVATAALPATTFTSADSQQSVGVSADRLVELITAVAAAHPGVPIDLLAHSQGGVVARLALERAAAGGRLPDSVTTLVTVGTPHAGAPLATGVRALRASPGGRSVLAELRGMADPLDDRLPAMAELAVGSPIMDELRTRPLPERVRFISLGGSGDLVVPGVVTVDGRADDQRILPTALGTRAHGDLTSDDRTTREIALGVTGHPLGCQSLTEAVGAELEAGAVATLETVATVGPAVVAAAPTGAAGALLPTD